MIERHLGEAGQAELEGLLASAAITPVPLEEAHLHWAPLLFKGDYLDATDLPSALLQLADPGQQLFRELDSGVPPDE